MLDRLDYLYQLVGNSQQENLLLYSFFFSFLRWGLYVAQAGEQWLFTGVIPLLISTGVLTYSFSHLGRFTLPRQPGGPLLPGAHHTDAQFSADTCSALLTTADNSLGSSDPPASASGVAETPGVHHLTRQKIYF